MQSGRMYWGISGSCFSRPGTTPAKLCYLDNRESVTPDTFNVGPRLIPALNRIGNIAVTRCDASSHPGHYVAEILSHICRSSASGSLTSRVSRPNTITGLFAAS